MINDYELCENVIKTSYFQKMKYRVEIGQDMHCLWILEGGLKRNWPEHVICINFFIWEWFDSRVLDFVDFTVRRI